MYLSVGVTLGDMAALYAKIMVTGVKDYGNKYESIF